MTKRPGGGCGRAPRTAHRVHAAGAPGIEREGNDMIHRKYLPGFARPCPRRTPVLLGALAGLALLAAWPAAYGAEPLTEPEAVRRALTRPALQDALQGGTAAAEADALEAGLWPNPHFDYEHERTGSVDGDVTEQRARLAQSFDISGRRALRREAAEQRVAASRHDATARRTTLAMEVRLAFHDSLGGDPAHRRPARLAGRPAACRGHPDQAPARRRCVRLRPPTHRA
ncbi:MAG: TolC family protein [Comamonadaceae bacterium]|nr:TolC family protein [Comamonadaceae bacterium]